MSQCLLFIVSRVPRRLRGLAGAAAIIGWTAEPGRGSR
jgi:hypothetical protein